MFSFDEEPSKERECKRQFQSFKSGDPKAENEEQDHFNEYVAHWDSKGIVPIMQCYNPKRGDANEIKMNNVMMGDQYAEAFAVTLPYKKCKSALSLRNNRLSQKGADAILK